MSVSIRHQARRRLWPSNCTRWKYLNYYRICSRLHTLICRPDTNIFPNFISPANLFRPFSAVGKVTASHTPPRNGPYICTERKRKGRINLLAWHVPRVFTPGSRCWPLIHTIDHSVNYRSWGCGKSPWVVIPSNDDPPIPELKFWSLITRPCRGISARMLLGRGWH